MGLLDKILGRTKDTAREIGEKAAPLAEKAGAAVGGVVDKARDPVGDRADDVKGGVDKATDVVDDKLTGALHKVDSATDHAVDAFAGSADEPAAEAAADEAPAEPGTPQ